MQTIDTFVR